MIAQYQLLGIRMQIHLLMHPVGNQMPVQVLLVPLTLHKQRRQPLLVVFNEAQEL
jgi:hypothetical protein